MVQNVVYLDECSMEPGKIYFLQLLGEVSIDINYIS